MTRELLNTLFVTTENAYVRLDGESLKVEADGAKLLQVPLHHLGSVMLFGTANISARALHRCAVDGRAVNFMDFGGRFKARVVGPTSGNVLLRQAQYEIHRDDRRAAAVARAIVAGKIRNARGVIARAAREVKQEEDQARLHECADALAPLVTVLPQTNDLDAIRGVEGQASALYFECFGSMLTVPPDEFSFRLRSRRPPRDRVNALLSFLYALLSADCVAACEGVGLDPQFGFLHCLRPGRPALALDLMEEFRPVLADRLVLTLINRKQVRPEHFEERRVADGGVGESVSLTDTGRKIVLSAYQTRKQEEVVHPMLRDKAPLGLLPHLQARLLARHLRGDMAAYVPFPA
jgi:CRISPR-associated protein Cas1